MAIKTGFLYTSLIHVTVRNFIKPKKRGRGELRRIQLEITNKRKSEKLYVLQNAYLVIVMGWIIDA